MNYYYHYYYYEDTTCIRIKSRDHKTSFKVKLKYSYTRLYSQHIYRLFSLAHNQ